VPVAKSTPGESTARSNFPLCGSASGAFSSSGEASTPAQEIGGGAATVQLFSAENGARSASGSDYAESASRISRKEVAQSSSKVDDADKCERIRRLKEYLASSSATHEKQISLLSTLKRAHVYCVIHRVAAQQYGPLLERYIMTKYGYKRNNPSDSAGDCSKGGQNIEIKVSFGGSGHKHFNYVQLRLFDNVVSYVLTAYYLPQENADEEGELFIFKYPSYS
jgi:hypothetical protein